MHNKNNTISVATISEQSHAGDTYGGKNVAIIGGGVAGLTAAHELIERGYHVTVYESRELGGKARSIPVPNTGTEGRLDLPGEHGFRMLPNFYHHLPDTLKRIPFVKTNVWENLTAPANTLVAFTGKPDLLFDNKTFLPFPESFADILPALKSWVNILASGLAIPINETIFFIEKLYVFFTSSDKRRINQWERISWWDYTRADYMSSAYQELISKIVVYFVAARGDKASARAMGESIESFFYSYVGRNNHDKSSGIIQILNRPTNEAWIDPWVNYLTKLGVTFNVGSKITGLTYENGKIINAQLTDAYGNDSTISADWFILAVPIECAIPLINQPMISADPHLGKLINLTTSWMTGIQFFLSERANINKGHILFFGSPWALTGITQAQFWPIDFPSTYGDGSIKDILSVVISEWAKPGVLYNKPANQCTEQEIANEVLAQIRNALDMWETQLPDNIIQSWVLDPGISNVGEPNIHNEDPLLINTVNSWDNRPQTDTKIRNLILAGDYVRVKGFDLACMETANESGRNAANSILDATSCVKTRATIFPRYKEPLLKIAQSLDDIAYTNGLPNLGDIIRPYFP